METLQFDAIFDKVSFKTQPKADKFVIVAFALEKSGAREVMESFVATIQPVISNGIEGFSLVGEEKTVRYGDAVKIHRDQIEVESPWRFGKCTSELEENGWSTVRLQFHVAFAIKDLSGTPQELLKFRGQTCKVELRYVVRQAELPMGEE
jgi:hypothetical protein